MQVVRTLIWIVLTALLVLFALNNWQPVEVRIWQTLILETKLPALVIGAFLLGLVPMWLIHRASRWRHRRRIHSLETALHKPHEPAAAAEPEPAPTAPPPPPATPPAPAPP